MKRALCIFLSLAVLAAALESTTHPSVFLSPEDLARLAQAPHINCTFVRIISGESELSDKIFAMRDVLDLLHARVTMEHKINQTHLINTLNNSETLLIAVESSDWDRRFRRLTTRMQKIDYMIVPTASRKMMQYV